MQFQAKLSIVKDHKIRDALSQFLKQTELATSAISSIGFFISLYSDLELEDLDWKTLCHIVYEVDGSTRWKSGLFGIVNLKFILFLIDRELLVLDNTVYLKILINELIIMPSGSRQERLILFDKDNDNLERFFVCKSSNEKRPFTLLIDTKIHNKFVVNLLDKFYKSELYNTTGISTNFARKFRESYTSFSGFEDVSDFNYSVFKSQYDFYRNNQTELKTLVKFYSYLYMISGYTELFKHNDPIDIVFLQKHNFLTLYEEGFEVVDLNPFEQFPSINKWIVRPNGFDKTTTALKSTSYIPMDFTKITYNYYIDIAKHFFWHSAQSLYSRNITMTHIIIFLNFIYEYKNNNIDALTEGIDYKKITSVELYSFRDYISLNVKKTGTYNSYISDINIFLHMCKDKELLDIENGAFDYLYFIKKDKPKGGDSIPEEDLSLLEEHLRKLSEGDDIFHNLCYIIFHLAIETELRINQLLSLKKSEIIEGMKKGQFFINSITKTSKAEEINQQISIYAKRHIDIAIKHTEALREAAASKYTDYIFLIPPDSARSNKDIKPFEPNRFTRFLKRECKKIGIKEYTASNLRDTHMTKAVEYGLKYGLSDLETSILTNHSQPSTTTNHYVDFKVRTFAEATYGVIIGDIDIKGNIIPNDNVTFNKEDTVDDNCGFCKESQCKLLNELGCPMCDGFVVTLDRIPYYEKKIKSYDEAIDKEEIKHEREHLLAQKRLYVAYLTELYKLREKVENN